MTKKIAKIILLFCVLQQARGQNNWAPVPCYNGSAQITKMFVDSLHDELIISCILGYSVCNATYKGMVAYNGSFFHNLDFGLDKYDPNLSTSGDKTMDCVPFNGKSLYGGLFASVGSNTLYSEAMAQWNGSTWDTFPKFTFTSNPSRSGYTPLINGFLRDNGKLWIYGGFKNLGGVQGANIYTFDGTNFTAVNIPISYFDYNYQVNKMLKYHNEIYALGGFANYPSNNFSRIAKYDGTNWSSIGNGIVGSIDGGFDMIEYNDTLYVGGSISTASGNAGNYLMKCDGSQFFDAGFGTFNSWYAITKMLVYRNRLYVFGNFTQAAGQKAFGVAYYENGKWTVPQDSIAGANIQTAAIYHGDIYIGGIFASINTDPAMKHLAKLRCPDFDVASGCVSSIHENSIQDLGVKIYPNPVEEKVTIEFTNSNFENSDLQISDGLGRILYSAKVYISQQDLNLTFLTSGIYYLRIKNEKGQQIFKIVKA